jgi:diguanylate cyclase (GGDEF)-like protein
LGENVRIVLVEPSRAVQRIMTEYIGHEHEVATFSEGQKALACIREDEAIRTLITSVHLPDISGIELCSAARNLVGSARPFFIMVMSSSEDYSWAVKALDNGADEFIRKPPFAEELRARLRAADRLTVMQTELIKLASTDSLTGLLNRRALFGSAAQACQAANAGKALCAIIFDIDHFKRINDTHGHEIGDMVLAGVSGVAKRAAKIVGRLGGEEFCILLHCEMDDAVQSAEHLRCSIAELRFPHGVSVTCSFGVAEWNLCDTIDGLLRRADTALYEAKKAGRDRVVAARNTNDIEHDHSQWRASIRAMDRKISSVS